MTASVLPALITDEPLVEVVHGWTLSTIRLGPFAGDPTLPGRWSTIVLGRDDIDEHVSSDPGAVWNWRAHVRELLRDQAGGGAR